MAGLGIVRDGVHLLPLTIYPAILSEGHILQASFAHQHPDVVRAHGILHALGRPVREEEPHRLSTVFGLAEHLVVLVGLRPHAPLIVRRYALRNEAGLLY